MSARARVEVLAPAKVNPLLEVLGRRADGYHEVRTVLLALELADRVVASADPELPPGAVELEVAGPHASPDVPRGPENLAHRAARAALERVRELSGVAPGVRLELSKNVPSQAGLGGGSSDAAAALAAVEALAGVDLGAEWRNGRLARLGADCAFFDVARSTGAALCTGAGERVEVLPAPDPAWWVGLVTPAARCPTGQVFSALEFPLSRPARPPNVRESLHMRAVLARRDAYNQLEEAALAAAPELRRWRAVLDAAGASHFRLAGSGSSFFGLFESADAARAAVERVVGDAGRRALALRGRWVTRSAGHGSKLVRDGA